METASSKNCFKLLSSSSALQYRSHCWRNIIDTTQIVCTHPASLMEAASSTHCFRLFSSSAALQYRSHCWRNVSLPVHCGRHYQSQNLTMPHDSCHLTHPWNRQFFHTGAFNYHAQSLLSYNAHCLSPTKWQCLDLNLKLTTIYTHIWAVSHISRPPFPRPKMWQKLVTCV